MAVMMPGETWSDHRLDDLNKKVDDGFARVDKKVVDGFARLDKKIDAGIRDLRVDMKDLQRELNQRLDSMNNRLVGGLFVFVAALIGSNAF